MPNDCVQAGDGGTGESYKDDTERFIQAVTYEDEAGRVIRRTWDGGEVTEEVVDRV